MRKTISATTNKWIKSKNYKEFTDYFIGLNFDKLDKIRRESAIEIAAIWCDLGEKGEDGKEVHPRLEKRILELATLHGNENETSITEIWLNMCANLAAYRFAKIDEFIFTAALYGVYRHFLPESNNIEPFSSQILEALMKAKGIEEISEEGFGYAVNSNGLKSEVVIIPKGAFGWTDYGDQFIIIISLNAV